MVIKTEGAGLTLKLPNGFEPIGNFQKSITAPYSSYKKKNVNLIGKVIRLLKKDNGSVAVIINLSEIEGHNAGEENLNILLNQTNFELEYLNEILVQLSPGSLVAFTCLDMKVFELIKFFLIIFFFFFQL